LQIILYDSSQTRGQIGGQRRPKFCYFVAVRNHFAQAPQNRLLAKNAGES